MIFTAVTQPEKIIPAFSPKVFRSNEEYCDLLTLQTGTATAGCQTALPLLEGIRAECCLSNSQGWEIMLGKCSRDGFYPQQEGGYSLHMEPGGIMIRGYDYSGLVAGIEFLNDLRRETGSVISCCDALDAPALSWRGYHLDLKKGYGDFQTLLNLVRRLRKLRYNVLLIEYENRIRYHCAPEIAAPDALNHEQVRKLVKLAEDSGMTVIPLVQSLGHLEYLLSHESMRRLRESDEDFSQCCPCKPESLAFFRTEVAELLALHPNSKYFHVGGDETRLLGHCPECAGVVRESSRQELYIRYMAEVCKVITGRGRIPILWDDMLTRHRQYELLKRLPEETILMYWEYNSDAQSSGQMNYEGLLISRQWAAKIGSPADFTMAPQIFSGFIENLPPDDFAYCRQLNSGQPGFPMHFKPLPYLPQIEKQGIRVIGAGAVRFSRSDYYLTGYGNLRLWLNSARGLSGLIMTSWAAANSGSAPARPASTCDHLLHFAGMLMWDSSLNEEELQQSYDQYLGVDGFTSWLRLVDCCAAETGYNWIEWIVGELNVIRPRVSAERSVLFDKYAAILQLEYFKRKFQAYRKNTLCNLWSGSLQSPAFIDSLLAEANELKRQLAVNFRDELREPELTAWIDGRIMPEIILLQKLKELLTPKTENAK